MSAVSPVTRGFAVRSGRLRSAICICRAPAVLLLASCERHGVSFMVAAGWFLCLIRRLATARQSLPVRLVASQRLVTAPFHAALASLGKRRCFTCAQIRGRTAV